MRFYPGSSIPASGHVGGIVVLNYPLSKFADVVSIFRDEEHLIVDTIAYDSAGQTVSGWSISGGPGLAGEMKP